MKPVEGEFFFLTRFGNLVAKRRKINGRVVPILVAVRLSVMLVQACVCAGKT